MDVSMCFTSMNRLWWTSQYVYMRPKQTTVSQRDVVKPLIQTRPPLAATGSSRLQEAEGLSALDPPHTHIHTLAAKHTAPGVPRYLPHHAREGNGWGWSSCGWGLYWNNENTRFKWSYSVKIRSWNIHTLGSHRGYLNFIIKKYLGSRLSMKIRYF